MNIQEHNSPVAQNVTNIIKAKGLKKKAVAEKAGYSEQEFSDMLNGRKLIKVADVVRIRDALEVDSSILFGEKREIEAIALDEMYEEIQVVTEKNELIASITSEDVIVKDGYKVVCVPCE